MTPPLHVMLQHIQAHAVRAMSDDTQHVPRGATVRVRVSAMIDGNSVEIDREVPFADDTAETLKHVDALVLQVGRELVAALVQQHFTTLAYLFETMEPEP